ncbi:hypothetical protein PoB_003642900 [Plakobranchus ocellatus]|uniref:Uncharacterized protein n=1 Tax=Plakobranchus ocellatus TaxID=259542 RepID=A0AAV4AUC3_9GAST|nr:hypothetical protein PoB_003642900 [Plakobranchus ocellatus]
MVVMAVVMMVVELVAMVGAVASFVFGDTGGDGGDVIGGGAAGADAVEAEAYERKAKKMFRSLKPTTIFNANISVADLSMVSRQKTFKTEYPDFDCVRQRLCSTQN